MSQTVLDTSQHWPCAPEASAAHHIRYSKEDGSSGGEIKQGTTGIQEQHIRWDAGTAGLVAPNEPQQRFWLPPVCGRFYSCGEIWAWRVTVGRYSCHAGYTAIPLTIVQHRDMSMFKISYTWVQCAILISQREGWNGSKLQLRSWRKWAYDGLCAALSQWQNETVQI